MRHYVNALMITGGLLGLSSGALAATVRFDVVPTSDNAATSVTVTPGADVPYQVYVQVTSDDTTTADNNGLSFFTLEILTNLTVEQRPLDSFAKLIADNFTTVASLGTVQDDDIVQIGGGQNIFAGSTAVAGIGTGTTRQLVGDGRFVAPATEGTYTVAPGADSMANVLVAGSVSSATQATFQAGPGFTIKVAQSTTGNGTTGSSTSAAQAVTTGIVLGGLGVMVFVAALFLLGPLAAMFAIVLLPLLFIAILMNL